jgi:hypothetical protein
MEANPDIDRLLIEEDPGFRRLAHRPALFGIHLGEAGCRRHRRPGGLVQPPIHLDLAGYWSRSNYRAQRGIPRGRLLGCEENWVGEEQQEES